MLSGFLRFLCVFFFFFNIFFLIPLTTLSGSPQFHASSFCISFLLSTYYVGAPKPGPGPFIQNRGHEGPGMEPRSAQSQAAMGFETSLLPWVVSASAGLKAPISRVQPASGDQVCVGPGGPQLAPTGHPPACPSLGGSCGLRLTVVWEGVYLYKAA